MAKEQFYDALTPFVSITLASPKSKFQAARLATSALDNVAELLGLGSRESLADAALNSGGGSGSGWRRGATDAREPHSKEQYRRCWCSSGWP
jgi:hypothetical protein